MSTADRLMTHPCATKTLIRCPLADLYSLRASFKSSRRSPGSRVSILSSAYVSRPLLCPRSGNDKYVHTLS